MRCVKYWRTVDLARRSPGEGSHLGHAAVRCSELEDYWKGRRDMLGTL